MFGKPVLYLFLSISQVSKDSFYFESVYSVYIAMVTNTAVTVCGFGGQFSSETHLFFYIQSSKSICGGVETATIVFDTENKKLSADNTFSLI